MSREISDTFLRLEQALVDAGVPAEVTRNVKGYDLKSCGAVNVLVNTGIDAAPFAGVLIEYAPKLTDPDEIGFVARCMMQAKGFADAVPWLLSLFAGYPANGLSESELWAIGHAIYTINNKTFYADVIAICRDKQFGRGRQILLGTLARARGRMAKRSAICTIRRSMCLNRRRSC